MREISSISEADKSNKYSSGTTVSLFGSSKKNAACVTATFDDSVEQGKYRSPTRDEGPKINYFVGNSTSVRERRRRRFESIRISRQRHFAGFAAHLLRCHMQAPYLLSSQRNEQTFSFDGVLD